MGLILSLPCLSRRSLELAPDSTTCPPGDKSSPGWEPQDQRMYNQWSKGLSHQFMCSPVMQRWSHCSIFSPASLWPDCLTVLPTWWHEGASLLRFSNCLPDGWWGCNLVTTLVSRVSSSVKCLCLLPVVFCLFVCFLSFLSSCLSFSYGYLRTGKLFWILNLRYTCGTYLLLMCGVSSHFLYCLFWWIEVFSINVVKSIISPLYGFFAFERSYLIQFFCPEVINILS